MRRKICICIVFTCLLFLALYPVPFMDCFFEHGYVKTYYLEEAAFTVRILIIAVMLIIFTGLSVRKILLHYESKDWTIKKLLIISIITYLCIKIFRYCTWDISGMSHDSVWLKFYGGELYYPRYLPMFLGLNIYYPMMLIFGAKTIAKQKTEAKYVCFFLWSVVQFFVIWPFFLFSDEFDVIRLVFINTFAVIVHLMCYYLYLHGDSRPGKGDLAGGTFLAAVSGIILWFIKIEDQRFYFYARLRHAAYIKEETLSLIKNAHLFGSIEDESIYCPVKNTVWFLLKEIGWFWAVCYVAIILFILILLWKICRNTKRKELRSVSMMSCTLISLRWGLWLAMTLGVLPYETSYSVKPFYGSMAFYDVFLIGIIVMPALPEKTELVVAAEQVGNTRTVRYLKRQLDCAAKAARGIVDKFFYVETDEQSTYDIAEEEWEQFQEWKRNKSQSGGGDENEVRNE